MNRIPRNADHIENTTPWSHTKPTLFNPKRCDQSRHFLRLSRTSSCISSATLTPEKYAPCKNPLNTIANQFVRIVRIQQTPKGRTKMFRAGMLPGEPHPTTYHPCQILMMLLKKRRRPVRVRSPKEWIAPPPFEIEIYRVRDF